MVSTFNLIIYLPGTLCDVLVAVFTFFSTVLTHLSAVLALLELLQQLAGPLDVAGQRETLLHVGHRILKKAVKYSTWFLEKTSPTEMGNIASDKLKF